MPVFLYTAKDRLGNLTTGTVDADTDSQAASRLREQGLWVTTLRRGGSAAPAAPAGVRTESGVHRKVKSPVPLKDLALYYRQLYTLLNSGMPLYGSLSTLAAPTQSPNAQLRRVVGSLAERVLAGDTLSGSMARFPWLFDRMQVRMVEAGEQGGLLVEICRRLADYLEREYEVRLEVKRKTLYPKLLLLALIFIPPLPALVLSGPAAYFWSVWNVLQYGALVLAPLWLAVRLLLTTEAGRQVYDRVKLALPVIGGLVRKMTVARFARTLAALYGAGVPIMSAIAMSGEASGNSVLEGSAARMASSLERGMPISAALGTSGFFQPMFIGMVSTGESSGNLDQMLDKAADFYEEEALHATVQLTVILGVVLLLGMALLIAIQVIGFWGGFYNSINSGGG